MIKKRVGLDNIGESEEFDSMLDENEEVKKNTSNLFWASVNTDIPVNSIKK